MRIWLTVVLALGQLASAQVPQAAIANGRIRATLEWRPQYDDLDTIAAHALAWEQKLSRERRDGRQHAESA